MSRERLDSRLAALLSTLKPKTKQPASAAILNQWIVRRGQARPGGQGRQTRLARCVVGRYRLRPTCDRRRRKAAVPPEGRHFIAASVVRDRPPHQGRRRTRPGRSRRLFLALEDALAEPWGPLTLRRGEVEVVNTPTKIVKPRRFDIVIALRGVTWRRIQFEVSADESGIGQDFEVIEPPPLSGFGLPDPETLVGIAMRFQIAQKLHAVSDPTNRQILLTIVPAT